jgi:hypothetical protein
MFACALATVRTSLTCVVKATLHKELEVNRITDRKPKTSVTLQSTVNACVCVLYAVHISPALVL